MEDKLSCAEFCLRCIGNQPRNVNIGLIPNMGDEYEPDHVYDRDKHVRFMLNVVGSGRICLLQLNFSENDQKCGSIQDMIKEFYDLRLDTEKTDEECLKKLESILEHVIPLIDPEDSCLKNSCPYCSDILLSMYCSADYAADGKNEP